MWFGNNCDIDFSEGKWCGEVLKIFVICVIPFLSICLSVFTLMLCGPDAFSLCILFSVFLISSGLVGEMGCVGGAARKSLTSFLVLLWKRLCV